MISDLVTRRYANALFNLASRSGALQDVQRDLERLETELRNPSARDALHNPRGDRNEKRQRFVGMASSMHPFVQNLIQLLFDRRREEVLAELPRAFRRRSLVERGAVEGVLETPRPVSDTELASYASTLGAKLGKEVLLENRVVADLVGGARLFADNRMIDYSVQGRLDDLRNRMLAAKLPVPVPSAPSAGATGGTPTQES